MTCFRELLQALMTHTYSMNHCPLSFQLIMVFSIFICSKSIFGKKKKPLFYVSIKSEKWIKPIICPSSVNMHKTHFVIFSNSKTFFFNPMNPYHMGKVLPPSVHLHMIKPVPLQLYLQFLVKLLPQFAHHVYLLVLLGI